MPCFGVSVGVAGRPLSKMSDNQKTDFRAMKMGFIFQSYNLLPVLRAVENVELPLLVRGDDDVEPRATLGRSLGELGPRLPEEDVGRHRRA